MVMPEKWSTLVFLFVGPEYIYSVAALYGSPDISRGKAF